MVSEIDDTSRFGTDDAEEIIIKAIGVGGGGNNAIDHMYREGIKNVSFVNINTDKMSLRHSLVPQTLVIGPGLGAGNKPEVAREYAEEYAEQISSLFDDSTKMVFITAGMGGGTGTGAGPVVARIAKEHDLLTIGIVTIPFLFEGSKKIAKALAGADEMAKYVDALLVINNERLTEIYPDVDLINGFAKADDTLATAARSISELITCTGRINVDFNDVNTTLRDGGAAIISTGYGEGENRVTKAIEDALQSPLLKNRDIMGSKKLLFNLYFSQNSQDAFRMEEVNELTQFVTHIGSGVDVIWGLAFDDSLGDKVKITILAAGFDVSLEEEEQGFVEKHKERWFDFGDKKGKKAEPKEKEVKVDLERLSKEYGAKIHQLEPGKDRSRYLILRPEQFDDDTVIEYLEENPTATRDKKSVERIRNNAGTEPRPLGDNHIGNRPGKRIDFSEPL